MSLFSRSLRTVINFGGVLISGTAVVALTLAVYVGQSSSFDVDSIAFLPTYFFALVLGAGIGFAWQKVAVRRLEAMANEHQTDNLRFNTAIDNISQGLCFFDGQQRLIICNKRYAEMYGLTAPQVTPGTTLREISDHCYRVGSFPKMARSEYAKWRKAIAEWNLPSETVTELKNGRIFNIRHQPMVDGGWVATHEDITEKRRIQMQIELMARCDELTGLANRVQVRERLEVLQAQAESVAESGSAVAVLVVDLDHFKGVNDALGHAVGDKLLRAAAHRMKHCARRGDLVARMGGDEFAIIQIGQEQPVSAQALARRLIYELGLQFEIGPHRIQIGASVGIALANGPEDQPEALLSNADLALYAAKSAGRSTHEFFRLPMAEEARDRRSLENELREAQARGEFELFYQPIFSITTGRVVTFEALLRWHHPTRGLVLPDTFIALAEETGLIESIGAWVLQEAFCQATLWPEHISVAINLSPVQIKGGNLLRVVAEALRDSGIEPERVELEITESVRLAEDEANLNMLMELRALGTSICLDDLGVGYSSLSYLRSFPFRKIKIDRSFVKGLVFHSEEAAIVRAICTLGNNLKMTIVAEGVEEQAQLDLLRELGCDEAQGYLLGRPMPFGKVSTVWQAESFDECWAPASDAELALFEENGMSESWALVV